MPAPVYRSAILTAYGRVLMSWLPPVLQESEDYMAIVHPLSKELERLEDRIELVRAQFFPQTATVLLWAWERLVRTAEAPVGVSVGDRQDVVMSLLRRGRADMLGAGWESRIERIVGAGWSYEEHDPANASGPPVGTVWITLPVSPGSNRFAVARTLIRVVTPAHLAIVLLSEAGFVWDESRWDQEAFGA